MVTTKADGSTRSDGPVVSIFPVLLVNFIGALGFSIVIPFMVFQVTRWGGNALVYGLVAATYPAWQFVGAPVLGRWSDVYGRRKILLLSQAGTLLSWLIFAGAFLVPTTALVDVNSGLGKFVLTIPVLIVFLARALDGVTGGNISVANAYLIDVTPEDQRGTNFGRMAVASNLGFIVGPALAGMLGSTALGELLPILAAAAISLVATCLVAFYLPESNPCAYREDRHCVGIRKVMGQEERTCFQEGREAQTSWRELLRQNNVTFMLVLYFLIFLGFNLFYTAFPVYAEGGLQWSVREIGIFFTVLSGVMVVVQGPVLARLNRKVNAPKLVVGGGVVLGLSFIVLTSHDTRLVYLAAVLFAVGNGLMWPSYMSLLSRTVEARYQGMLQGMAASAGSVASIVGLILGGIAYIFLAEKTFVLSAAIIFAACLLSTRLVRSFPTLSAPRNDS